MWEAIASNPKKGKMWRLIHRELSIRKVVVSDGAPVTAATQQPQQTQASVNILVNLLQYREMQPFQVQSSGQTQHKLMLCKVAGKSDSGPPHLDLRMLFHAR